jgi:mRNA interferase MazF
VNTNTHRGEVWLADLGMVAKTRPVLVLAIPQVEDARSIVVVAALTSQLRGMRGEVDIGKPRWLTKHSAVNVQALSSLDQGRLLRCMGTLGKPEMEQVKEALRDLLDL